MPTYDLMCHPDGGGCGHEFEYTRKMTDPNPPFPECGSNVVITIVKTPPLTVMKGDGWASKEITESRKLEESGT